MEHRAPFITQAASHRDTCLHLGDCTFRYLIATHNLPFAINLVVKTKKKCKINFVI